MDNNAKTSVAIAARDEATEIVAVDQSPVAMLFQMAQSPDLDVEKLERLMALAERDREQRAEQAMIDALASLQSSVGPIQHNKEAEIATNGGGKFKYTYAELPAIADQIREPLRANGLSYSWDTDVTPIDGQLWVEVICTTRHIMGAVRTSSFKSPVDGRENRSTSTAQKVKALVTFGCRVSLLQALGLTTADSDTDGRGAGHEPEPTIAKEQAAELVEMIEAVGGEKYLQTVCRWAGVSSLFDLPKSKYEEAYNTAKTRLEQKQGGAS